MRVNTNHSQEISVFKLVQYEALNPNLGLLYGKLKISWPWRLLETILFLPQD